MFKTKLVSSQVKAFVDDKIDSFDALYKCSALLGERVSVQLLYVDEGETDFPYRSICSLKVEGGLSQYVTIRDVRNLPVEKPINIKAFDSQYLRTTPGLYPDILTPLRYNGSVVVGYEKLRSLWIEIDIPKDYKGDGKLKFSLFLATGANGDTGAVNFDISTPVSVDEVEIELINKCLPEQQTLFTQWFYADCLASYYGEEAWSERHFEIVEKFLKTYAKRGRNMVYTPVLTPALNVRPPYLRKPCQLVQVFVNNGEYSFDFSLLDRWIDILDRVGIEYMEISHFFHQKPVNHSAKVYATVDGTYKLLFGWETGAVAPEYIDFLRKMIAAMIEHLKKRGDDKRCYYHIADEPTEKSLELYIKQKEAIADVVKGYPVMDALSEVEFYESKAVEIPVPVTSKIGPFLDKNIEELWTYYACNEVVGYSNCYLAMPSWRTRSLGMQLYKFKIKGFLHWGFNYYNNWASGDAINPYMDLSGEDWVCAGDTFVVYPDSDGSALESIRAMTLEEALQDIRAMELCEKYYSHKEVVAAMEEELGEPITFERCAHSEDEMLRIRERINKMIAEKIK